MFFAFATLYASPTTNKQAQKEGLKLCNGRHDGKEKISHLIMCHPHSELDA